jgi:phage terminase large subunit
MKKTEITIEVPIEYKRLFDTDWREAAVYGGRFSLKSHTVARTLLIRARQNKIRVACFREFQNSIADSSHQLLSTLIKEYGLNDFSVTDNSIINTVNGSDFIFKGLWNNEQRIKSIEGIDIAWVEEAQTVSNKSLEVLTPTVRKDGSQIIYTYNRLQEDDPVHKRLVLEGRPNTLIINTNYDIALKYGMMPEVIRLEMEDDKVNRPGLFKHKWLGEPWSQELRIYNNWKIIDEIPHEARLERRYLDFGFTNDPSAIGEVYYYNGGWILNELLYRQGMSNKQLADFLNALDKPQTVIIADSAEPKSISELQGYGLNIVGCKKGKDSVNAGIQLVQDQPISVTRWSYNILQEQRNYMWWVDKNGRTLNQEDPGCANHHMSGIRYALETLGRLKQEANYWDRVFEDELNPKQAIITQNRGK